MFFFCVFTQTTRFFFFSLFKRKKTIQRSMSPKWIGFIRPVFQSKLLFAPLSVYSWLNGLCSTVFILGSEIFLFLSPSTDEAKKNTPSITPHDTLTHTPLHRSTVTRGRIFRKDFRRRKKLKQPRGQMPEIGTSQTALTALNFGRRTTGWKQIISRRDKYD